jgi:hypothetical protein
MRDETGRWWIAWANGSHLASKDSPDDAPGQDGGLEVHADGTVG